MREAARAAKDKLAEQMRVWGDRVTGIGLGRDDDGGYYLALNVRELPGPRGSELMWPPEVNGFEVRVHVTGEVKPL